MNPAVARHAGKPGKAMIGAMVDNAIIVSAASGPCIMRFVPGAGLKPRFPSNPNRIAKSYAGIASAQEATTGNRQKKNAVIVHGVFNYPE